MSLRIRGNFRKAVVIIVIILGASFLAFYGSRMAGVLQSVVEDSVVNSQLGKIREIDRRLQRNYHIAQGLFLSKVWEEKFAFDDDKRVARYLGPESLNPKLFLQAEAIGRKYGIEIEAELKPLTYFYKEENQKVAVGFIVLDYAGIKIGKINQ